MNPIIQDVVAGVIAIILVVGTLYLVAVGTEIPDLLAGATGIALGWVFKASVAAKTP